LDFGGRTVLLDDSSINTIVRLMANEIESCNLDRAASESLSRRLQAWVSEIEESGVGCIDIRLDDSLSDTRAVEQTLKLLDAVETTIRGFGDTVPRSFFRKAVGPEYYQDVEARIILRDLNKFRNLLIGG